MDEHGIIYRKIRDGPIIFHAIMVPNTLQPYILYECHNTLGHIGSTRLYHLIERNYYWKSYVKIAITMYVPAQNINMVTLKEPQYINFHLPIPNFPMSFISMDFVGPYRETENGNQCALTHHLHIDHLRIYDPH